MGQEDLAEVIGLEKDGAVVSPIGDVLGLSPSTRVVPTGKPMMIEVGTVYWWCFRWDGKSNHIISAERSNANILLPCCSGPTKANGWADY